MIRKVVFFVMVFVCLGVQAQRHEILTENIRTLQVLVNGNWNQSPILHLGSHDYFDISFDDLTHEYHRYRYRIEQCNFDWTTNERLFDSDYLRGETGDQPIEEYEKSINTTVLYTHYTFRFPNSRVGVAASGNYRITIFDDDEEEDVATVCFFVVEDKAPVSASASTSTDIDENSTHQQVRFNVNPQNLRGMTNPQQELKTVILQNNRWDNAAINPKVDFITPTDLQWKYAKDLIFNAGNEYRKFELINLHYGSLGIDKIRWFDPYYHALLYQGKDRVNYIYDEDQDGAFYIRTQEYDNANLQSDYVLVHFSVKHAPEPKGEYYVNGDFCYGRFLPECKMEYNQAEGAYEATILLKQGYYNYQYFYLPEGSDVGDLQPVEGNYYQTENKYTILVYFRPPGGRYDQLVGFREFKLLTDR